MIEYKSASLREVQLYGLSILKDVVELCEKYNITYFLSCGTLLGAIRHKGFIPWDNDIDIEMPIKDYKRFLRIAAKELPSHLFLQTYYTDPGYNEMWAKVRANGTTSLPVAWRKLKLHWGIGIDIFPLTGLYEGKLLRKMQLSMHSLSRNLLAKDFVTSVNPTELQHNKKLQLLYTLPRRLRIAICRFLEKLIFKNPGKSTNVSVVFIDTCLTIPGKAYDSAMYVPFEDSQFCVPKNSDLVLTSLYGDYMTPPPVNERNGHEGALGSIIYSCNTDYNKFLDQGITDN